MPQKPVTLAVVALLAIGASGVAAASIAEGSTLETTTESSPEPESPANYTVEVVDPHDRLDARDVEDARELAWANETVRSHLDDVTSAHFHVEAVGSELQVYVAPNSSTPPVVLSAIDLDASSVETVEALDTVVMAENVTTTTLSPVNASKADSGEVFTVETTAGTETLSEENVHVEAVSVSDRGTAADSDTVRIVATDSAA